MKFSRLLFAFLIVGQAAAIGPDTASTDHVQAIYTNLVHHHWVPQTGLFASFTDSADPKISQQASIYDQSIVGLLALQLGDIKRAQGIFKFFKKEWGNGPLANFYNAEFGGRGIEPIVQVGPNAWAALFAARLSKKTDDRKPFKWSLSVAEWIAHSVPHLNGAVAMAPATDPNTKAWATVYSTENNISYNALLSELLQSSYLTAKDKEWIQKEKGGIEHWLVHEAFDPQTYSMNRGINGDGIDSIHALDSFTLMLAAIGPDRLAAQGIDPDQLMKRAQDLFEVSVGGVSGVDPTDQQEADFLYRQSPAANDKRPPRLAEDNHRMIWFEGLGQYILALNTMARYSAARGQTDQASNYAAHADRLAKEFDRAAIPGYSGQAAYPYATAGKFFRDGWQSPRPDALGPASSLVSACYRAFIDLDINPLSGQPVKNLIPVEVKLPRIETTPHALPDILYGSSENMIAKAWDDLNGNQTDLALKQAQATISEWVAVAQDMQKQKQRDIGHLIPYNRTPACQKQIVSYGVLNDVGAAYFIVGKILDKQSDYLAAAHAFFEVSEDYSLAQVWNKTGWFFWSPLEAVQHDYISQDPNHYGRLLPSPATLAKAN